MEAKRRYSTMVFPQGFDGNLLHLNIVLIPRNQDPFVPYNTGLASHPAATAFASLVPSFEVAVSNGLEEWPIGNATGAAAPVKIPVNVPEATGKMQALQAIAAEFGAKINMDGSTPDKTDKAPDTPLPESQSVQKYLPETYRKAFNFTTPRHPNAKLDDSYHCALKKDTPKKDNWKNNDDLSWGQVFAHILRQPMLARTCGMIYTVSVDLGAHPGLLAKGGFLYVNLTNNGYADIQQQLLDDPQGPFIKRYAARIPALTPGEPRPVFAPLLFPVLHRTTGSVVDPEPPKAEWDKIFAELNEYNDGFAKIVHAGQQVSNNILAERQDGPAPQSDTGIRLAWDDEQIMIWYLRQLSGNPMEPGKRLDVPMGVYGYRIDVRADEENSSWGSLNLVETEQQLTLGGVPVGDQPNQQVELPYQVFPSQLDNNTGSPYWLPMYFTNWTGKSLVLKDMDAIRINRHAEARASLLDPSLKSVDASSPYHEVPAGVDLRYGNRYAFRVRMMDISGGGPSIQEDLFNNAPAPSAKHHFKRYVSPGLCRIEQPEPLRTGLSSYFNKQTMDENGPSVPDPVLRIRRPLLNYPAVVFTGKYQAAGLDPVELLIGSAHAPEESKVPGIADPDVVAVEIQVEIETLKLDNLLSDSGRENYITLYTTRRNFPAGFEDELELPVIFHDVPVLLTGNPDDPFNRPDLDRAAIDAMTEIPLPSARRIRVTVRAICEGDGNYFGFVNPGNKDADTRYGKAARFWFHRPSQNEEELLLPQPNVPELQGIYLQPDPPYLNTGKIASFFLLRETDGGMPDIVQRFAQKLGLRNNGLTLMGKKGQRVVFGCSNRIRHHLAPDHGSITFSSKGDLCNHWLGCVVYRLNRDWTWNALEETSFTISRRKKFARDANNEAENISVLGDIEVKRTASFECLQPDELGDVNREHTLLVFIDAIEPKSSLERPGGGLRYPDELEVEYTLTPRFRPQHGGEQAHSSALLRLPTTIAPAQVPEIASVGIAFSPYRANERYSATEPRQKFLWVELKEPVKDPHDTLFCRVLAYAPDQLLSNNQGGIISEVPEEPALPVDPEYIRAITPGQTDDMAGLGAMQAMEKAAGNDDLHYLLPLPPGLHAESPELFGFFTYEFRIGHGHWSLQEDEKGHLWSTAQGRFGRPLRVTGMQHPAPNLLCNVNRDKNRLYLTAPYAKAVWKGRNVTADPPRTQLHGLLYAQVRQADGKGYRNILLDEKVMILNKPQVQTPPRPGGAITPDLTHITPGTAATPGGAHLTPGSAHLAGSGHLTGSAQLISGSAHLALAATHLSLAAWTVEDVDVQEKANVLLSNLSLLEEDTVSLLQLDDDAGKKVNAVLKARKAGRADRLDEATSARLVAAFRELKEKEAAPVVVQANAVNAGQKFTKASIAAGALIAAYKDIAKTATTSWDNKEISLLLAQLGLPQDAPLSVLVVEVFGNISSIFEHLGMPMDQVEQLTKRQPNVYAAMAERVQRRSQALSGELGNYRILRTSPLTEVPFVCCTTCG